MKNEPLKILMVGTGRMARRHLEAYQQIPNALVVGAVSKSKQGAKRFEQTTGIRAFTSIHEAIAKTSTCAMDICTPTETHYEIAKTAIEHNLHTIVEKPLAYTIENAAHLAKLSVSKRMVLATAHTEAFTPAIIGIRDTIEQTEQLEYISVFKIGDSQLPADAPNPNLWSKEQRRNRLFDLLVHMLSQVFAIYPARTIVEDRILPKPGIMELIHEIANMQALEIDVKNFSDTPGAEVIQAELLPASGVRIRLSLNNALAAAGLTKGLRATTSGNVYLWRTNGRQETLQRFVRQHRAKTPRGGKRIEPPQGDPFLLMLRNFVDKARAAQEEEQIELEQDFVDGAIAVALAHRIIDDAYATNTRAHRVAKSIIYENETYTEFITNAKGKFMRNVFRLATKELPKAIQEAPLQNLPQDKAQFLSQIEHIRHLVRLKPYHVRFLWKVARQQTERIEDEEALTALIYSGSMGYEHVLRLDTVCNQKCLFCNVGAEPHRDLFVSDLEARSLISALANRGVSRITFTGGEPTLRPELPELIEFAHSSGFDDITIQSNAVLLSNLALTCELKDAGLDMALISLHSHIERLSDFLTHAKGTWRKTIEGIKNLLTCNTTVRLAHVLTTANAKFFPQFVRFVAQEFGGKITDIDILINQHTGRGANRGYLVPKLSEIRQYIALGMDEANRLGITINNALTIPPCLMPGEVEHTLEYQRMLAYKRFGISPPEDLKILANEKVKGPQCQRCSLNEFCLGLWKGYALLHGTDELEPIIR